MPETITNSEGQVAVRHLRLVPIRVQVGGVTYLWSIRANISLAWVAPEHVDYVLSTKGGCCGNKNKKVFVLADETHVRRWENNGGR